MIWARLVLEGIMVVLFLAGTIMELWARDARTAIIAAIFMLANAFLMISDICLL